MKKVLCCLLFFLFLFPFQADIITLQDGREIHGTVINTDDEGIHVDTGISIVFFPHRMVRSIEEAPLEEQLFNRAQASYLSRNYRRAYEFIEEALKIAPDNEKIQQTYEIYREAYHADSIEQAEFELRMIRRLIDTGELIEANQVLDQLSRRFEGIENIQQKINEQKISIYLAWGQQSIERYNFSAALSHVQRAKDLRPEDEDILVLELDLLRRTGQPATVIENHLRKLRELFPGNYNYFFDLARHYYNRQHYNRVIQVFEEYFSDYNELENYPESKQIYASSHFSAGERIRVQNPDQAIEHYKQSIELNPQIDQNYLRLGELYYAEEEYDTALEYLETAQTRLASNTTIFYLLGNIHVQKMNFETARQNFARTVLLAERQRESLMHYNGLIALAELNFITGYTENAIINARTAVELLPERFRGYYWLGVSLAKLDRITESNEFLYVALEIEPVNELTLVALVQNLMKEKKFDEARRLILLLLNLHPQKADYYFKLGELYYLQGQYIAAEVQYQRTLERDKEFIQPYLRLSEIYRLRDETEKAMDYAYSARELAPDDSSVYVNLGIIYQTNLNEYALALENYNKYYELGGTDPQVQVWIRECRAELQRLER